MPAPLIEFPADVPDRAIRFWGSLLGAELEPRTGDAGAGWGDRGGEVRLGLHERGSGSGRHRVIALYFTVPDLPGALGAFRRLGDR